MNIHVLTDAELERIVVARTTELRGRLSQAISSGIRHRNRAELWRLRCLNGRSIDALRLHRTSSAGEGREATGATDSLPAAGVGAPPPSVAVFGVSSPAVQPPEDRRTA